MRILNFCVGIVLLVECGTAAASVVHVTPGLCRADQFLCASEGGLFPGTLTAQAGSFDLQIEPFDPTVGTPTGFFVQSSAQLSVSVLSPVDLGGFAADFSVQLLGEDGTILAPLGRSIGETGCSLVNDGSGQFKCFEGDTLQRSLFLGPEVLDQLQGDVSLTYRWTILSSVPPPPGAAIDTNAQNFSVRMAYLYEPAAAVPEPAAALTFAAGLAVVGVALRRR